MDTAFLRTSHLAWNIMVTLGSINSLESLPQQNDAIFIAADMLNNPHWELNAGAGFGLTPATDSFVFKIIAGRRVYWKKKQS